MPRHEALSLLDLIYEGKFRPDRHAKLLESETLPPEPPDGDIRPRAVGSWHEMVDLQATYRSEQGSAKQQQAAIRFRDAVAAYRAARELGFTAPQLLYASIGGNIQMLMRISKALGEGSIEHCEALKAEWHEWNEEHGFDYRVAAGIPHRDDRERLANGEKAEEGAPPPPYLELLA